MDMPHCIYPLIADRSLGSFHFVAIVSDAAIEIHIQVLVCKYVCVCSLLLGMLLGVKLMSYIINNSMFNYLKNCSCFPKRSHHFTFPSAVHEGSNFPTFLPIIVIIWLYDSSHSSGHKEESHGFDLHFPDGKWCQMSFYVLTGHWSISSLENYIFRSFAHFIFLPILKLGDLSFCYWVVWVLCIL